MKSFTNKNDEQRFFSRCAWLAQVVWAGLLLAALAFQQYQSRQEVLDLARESAALSFTYSDSLRRWNLHAGGVYIPTDKVGSSQVVTCDGLRLQRMVPAQMLSHIQSNFPNSGVRSHITSLDPINPANSPDIWEQKHLLSISEGSLPFAEVADVDGESYYRVLHPLSTNSQCQGCHDEKRLKVSATRGALSILVPMRSFERMLQIKGIGTTISLMLLWLVGSIGISTATRSLRKRVYLRDQALLSLQRSNNLYSALSATNQAIAQQVPQKQLFQQVCEIAVRYGGFKLAWVGMVDKDSKLVEPVARAGSMCDYIDEIRVSIDPDCAEGTGPTSIAIRENRTVIVDNFLRQLADTPWYAAAHRNGIRSSGAYPILSNGEVIGALKVYADETDFFTTELSQLMQQMVVDLSFANYAMQQQQQLQHSQALNQTLIDALPYPALLARFSDKKVVVANRKALEMGIVIGEVNHCCQLPNEKGDGTLQVKERQRTDGQWDMVCWCPVSESVENDLFLHFAVDITDRKKQESQINDIANQDALTGLANRRYFNAQLKRALQHASGQPFTLILLDLDEFKLVNDTYGHLVGDQLLIQISRRLQGTLRECDTLCRWGGDEFVIMLSSSTVSQSADLVQRIRNTFAQPFKLRQITVVASCSIGLASYPENGDNADDLIKAVDQAMYSHKATQRKDCPD